MIDLSEATQNYLKAVYHLTRDRELASTNELAKALSIQPASVTSMVQKLSQGEPPLLIYHKRQGVRLTEAGRLLALGVIRHHRLLETFLHDVLGYGWDEVHEEADRLEHAISEEMVARIAEILGDPRYDPHGDPIPDEALNMPVRAELPLQDLQPGDQCVIVRVSDEDANLLRHLQNVGLVPGSKLELLAYIPFDGNLQLQIEDVADPIVIGPDISSKIIVLKQERE